MLKKLFTDSYYQSLPEEDFRGRQRYILFIALTLMAAVSGLLFFLQNELIYHENDWFSYSLPCLSVLAGLNYFYFRKHLKTRIAYPVIILSCFLVLHLTSYSFGGIYSSSNFFLSVVTISTFILMGNRAGWYFVGLCALHIGLMYYLTIDTQIIKHLLKDMPGALEADLASSLIISLVLVGMHLYMVERSNRRITQEMKDSHSEINTYIQSVEKTNKELDSFAYIVSHDLKAPLRAIHSLSGWIEDDMADKMDEQSRDNFKMLKNRVERMEGLINGVLEYSRAGRKHSDPVSVNTKELLNDVVFMLAPGENVKIEIGDNMPVLMAEKIKLHQVFTNLLSNAIKYNDKEDIIIHVECSQLLHEWKFSISDNGPGIEEQYRSKVFEIFQTLQAKDKVESTGVGLAIVKKIIEENHGEIHIDSNDMGGASFIFTMPKRSADSGEWEGLKLKSA